MTPARVGLCAAFALWLGAVPSAGAEARIHAELRCPKAQLGRVLCEVKIGPKQGRLAWADVLVVRAPEFAKPLKSRVALSKGINNSEPNARLTLALVAKTPGTGRLEALARAVVCSGASSERELCRPESLAVAAEVVVSPP